MATAKTPTKTTSIAEQKAAANDEPQDKTFEFKGETYVIPADFMDNLEFFEAGEVGNEITAIKALLGPEQWNTFKESIREPDGRVRLTNAGPFMEKLREVMDESGN